MMKCTLALLSLFWITMAQAQPIFRCIDQQGNLSLQGLPCTHSEALAAKPDHLPVHARTQGTPLAPEASVVGVENMYAENRRRCKNAQRAATMCGKFLGMFSCGEHGFEQARLTPESSIHLRTVKGNKAINMQRCVQQVSE